MDVACRAFHQESFEEEVSIDDASIDGDEGVSPREVCALLAQFGYQQSPNKWKIVNFITSAWNNLFTLNTCYAPVLKVYKVYKKIILGTSCKSFFLCTACV